VTTEGILSKEQTAEMIWTNSRDGMGFRCDTSWQKTLVWNL